MGNYDEILHDLQETFPLVPHTNAGRLYSTVRRMSAEREAKLPIELRTGFVISVEYGKPANELDQQSWDSFYSKRCSELKVKYPDLHDSIFGSDQSSEQSGD